MENLTNPVADNNHASWSTGIHLLDSGCLLPVQYNHLIRKSHVVDGEIKLMLAVLKDAIRTYIRDIDGQTAQARRDFLETYQWFHAADQDGVFAYDNVCESLGLEPSRLRRWLKSMHDAKMPPRRALAR
jgi:hypothetical protein